MITRDERYHWNCKGILKSVVIFVSGNDVNKVIRLHTLMTSAVATTIYECELQRTMTPDNDLDARHDPNDLHAKLFTAE